MKARNPLRKAQKNKFYITTPIFYVNDVPHIGHSYTMIAADIMARWHRMKSEDVFFLAGTDEHGEKMQAAAEKKGMTPQQFVDELVPKFKDVWKVLNISNDFFIRTTDPLHEKTVKKILELIYKNGDIYKGEYEGWYCIPDETFWTELQLVDGKCPECGREVKKLKEETYFFRLSKYQNKLLELYENNPGFVSPDYRKNEIINRVKEGLRDLSITRTAFKWGIEFPFDKNHIIYVWVEALINYISALEYPGKKFKKFWPPDVHLIGKEINWFHSVIWPAMLMSADIELPKMVFAHGWWTVEGKKMSKSVGNTVNPLDVVKMYGADSLRYFLMREVSFGMDGDYSEQALMNRINSDLADNLGNLVNRSLVLTEKYSEGIIPKTEKESFLKEKSEETIRKVNEHLEDLKFHHALENIFSLSSDANRYINESEPWKMTDKKELDAVLYNVLETIRIISILLYPFMPQTSERIAEQVGMKKEFSQEKLKWGLLKPGTKTKRGDVLFRKVMKVDLGE